MTPGVEPANALEQIGNLLVLETELDRVGQVLVLAAAALAEVRAERFAPGRRGGLDDAEQFGPREALLDFRDFRFHDLARGDERNEDDKILHVGRRLRRRRQYRQSSRSTCRLYSPLAVGRGLSFAQFTSMMGSKAPFQTFAIRCVRTKHNPSS
jgi:hypothetical protein